MRLKTMGFKHLLASGVITAICGCDQGNAATGAAPATSGDGVPASYMLVIQVRPESVEKHFAFQRAAYEVCAAAAKVQHIVAKPMVAVPNDFVLSRKTYASDGKRLLYREVNYSMEFVDWDKKGDCQTRMSMQSSVSVITDGQDRSSFRDENGKVTVDAPRPYPMLPIDRSLLEGFTSPKIVNGFKLKCDNHGLCIVDPVVAVITQDGEPVIAFLQVDNLPPGKLTTFAEPVSLTVNKPIDPALFALDKF
jgi:hypothetical protein